MYRKNNFKTLKLYKQCLKTQIETVISAEGRALAKKQTSTDELKIDCMA